MNPAGGRLEGRIVLVTGASRGLGAAVAAACAGEGAKLVLVGRTRGALEEVDDACRRAGGAEATIAVLDLTKGELVDALGGSLHQRFGHLDGLVACAAELGVVTPASHLEPKTFDRILALNLIANQRLIRSVDPLLRAAPNGRAVFVTDGGAGPSRPYWGSRRRRRPAWRLWLWPMPPSAPTRVRVNLFDPGPMATRLRAQAYPGERPGAVPDPAAIAPQVIALLTPDCTSNGTILRVSER